MAKTLPFEAMHLWQPVIPLTGPRHYMVDSSACRWHHFYAMGHCLATGIHYMLRFESAYLERAASSVINATSFIVNRQSETGYPVH
jgi:hypothetical protein